ncbi:hypothetical protein GCM10020367_21600 [Streptomyces sannanensis]|uniref:Uncharacterized protein n=1 Tax=Streptomyces sannanensis TaxID=285536 RepID=A0ABP6S9T2_9ACTN
MPPVSIELTPNNGREVTLDDLRRFVAEAEGRSGALPIVVDCNNKRIKRAWIELPPAKS